MPYKKRQKEYDKRKRERVLDRLAALQEFEESIAPELRKMLLEGASAEDVMEKAAPMAAARIASIALTEKDSSKALAAAKDIVDRVKGKAVERRELSHRFDKLDDDALDALVISKLRDAAVDETLLLEEGGADDTEEKEEA